MAAIAGTLAITALVNARAASNAERRHPPSGRFLEVNGARLHYLERGTGEPLVLLHGNGSMIEDFESSGLIELAARKHRVIAFDRPGFGHSSRPRRREWSAAAQADLFHEAMERLGVQNATVLGHSWGASVALALALRFPSSVRGLVLASGYYYPSARFDALAFAGPAVPVIGDLLRHTVSPVAGRLFWPVLMRKIFGPAPVPPKFSSFPREMALRPSQIRAAAAEAGLLVPTAAATCDAYANLKMPVVIVVGDGDRLIDPDEQSARLHRDVPHSSLRRVPGAGHMVHQTDVEAVMAAIDEASLPARP